MHFQKLQVTIEPKKVQQDRSKKIEVIKPFQNENKNNENEEGKHARSQKRKDFNKATSDDELEKITKRIKMTTTLPMGGKNEAKINQN